MAIEKIPAGSVESSRQKVAIEKKTPEIIGPEQITRLGKHKLEFLANLAGIKNSDKLLELFGGSNLSTVVFSAKRPECFVSIDLRYAPSKRVEWSYKTVINFSEAKEKIKARKFTKPSFIAADVAALPIKDESFSLVLAPDSPRTTIERLAESEERHKYTAGTESELSPEEQENLFLIASGEAYRVLQAGGRYSGTAPISWARKLKDIGFLEISLIGSKKAGTDVEETKEYSNNRNVQFKSEGMKNPVVYFKCIK